MKANKILLIIQTVLMYISMIAMYVAELILPNNEVDYGYISTPMFYASIAINGVALAITVAIIVLSIITIFKKKVEDATQFTMIIKVVLIPWYIANFALWGLLAAAMLNPFLFFVIPLVICISTVGTYVFMFGCSFNNICTLISELKAKKIKINGLFIAGMILQIFFCIDIVGAILTFIAHKKNSDTISKNDAKVQL